MSGQLKSLENNRIAKRLITATRKKRNHLFMPAEVNFLREIRLTYATIGITFLTWAFATWELFNILWNRVYERGLFEAAEQLIFILIVNALIYGNVVYQFTRLGYLKRRSDHRPADREELDTIYEDFAPALTILVPSYKEDINIVRRTLLSAAMQDYPKRRVVLLIDDPPGPSDPSDLENLRAIRELPSTIQALLDPIAARFMNAYDAYRKRQVEGCAHLIEETFNLASFYREAATWFDRQAVNYPVTDSGDALLVKKVLAASAQAHHQRADELEWSTMLGDVSERSVLREYRRLTMLFQVEVTSFERKRYVNLSHEPNKAMNLNSYIGLMGKSFREIKDKNGLYLECTNLATGNRNVPDAEFLITLDADSLLVTDYAIRLIHFMMQPGNEKVAVAQTPYCAIPNAAGILERVAGATTDIQYIIHQGFTHFRATYWVGANALLRKKALDDIRVVYRERGFEITRYIQDRTVIEDTESSIDLIERNWQLYNYPERLAYSATPADFGALLIQRGRWANGGTDNFPQVAALFISRTSTPLQAGRGVLPMSLPDLYYDGQYRFTHRLGLSF
jgi:cellulose synthase/poly-beta-1,6-N-acetylglucosamine synthase-like glycosyltransferase